MEMGTPIMSIINNIKELNIARTTMLFNKLDYDLDLSHRPQMLESIYQMYNSKDDIDNIAQFNETTNPSMKFEDLRSFLQLPNKHKSVVFKEFKEQTFTFKPFEDKHTEILEIDHVLNEKGNMQYLKTIQWMSQYCKNVKSLDLKIDKNATNIYVT